MRLEQVVNVDRRRRGDGFGWLDEDECAELAMERDGLRCSVARRRPSIASARGLHPDCVVALAAYLYRLGIASGSG